MRRNTTLSMVMIAMFAALTAIGAFIKVPLPYVPFTLQIVFVFLAGSLLGSRNGLLSQVVYIAVGLIGLPVFTQGGGFTYVLQPTFGYLIGFAVGAFAIGKVIERFENPTSRHFILANLVGVIVIYAIGVPYLYAALNIWLDVPASSSSFVHVLVIGFLTTVPVDIGLAVFLALLAERLYKMFKTTRYAKIYNKKEEKMI